MLRIGTVDEEKLDKASVVGDYRFAQRQDIKVGQVGKKYLGLPVFHSLICQNFLLVKSKKTTEQGNLGVINCMVWPSVARSRVEKDKESGRSNKKYPAHFSRLFIMTFKGSTSFYGLMDG